VDGGVEPTIGGLFEGHGGLTMGVQRAIGGRLAWYSEIDLAACAVLTRRNPGVPNLGDVRCVEWDSVPRVDVLTLGFPCQDISDAGQRAGLRPGTRSGLWDNAAKAISILRPELVVIENVRGLLSTRADDSGVERCPWCMGDGGGGLFCEHSDVFSATWPTVGTMRNGVAYALPTSGHRTAVSGYSSSPDLLPTPTASDRFGPGEHGDGGPEIRTAMSRLFPTPGASDGEKGGPNQRGSAGDRMLPSAVMALLPTPAARDAGRGAGWGDQPGRPLSETIHRLLPTPRVAASRTGRSTVKNSSTSPSLEQAIEIAQGVLPREFETWDGLPPSWHGDRTDQPSDAGN